MERSIQLAKTRRPIKRKPAAKNYWGIVIFRNNVYDIKDIYDHEIAQKQLKLKERELSSECFKTGEYYAVCIAPVVKNLSDKEAYASLERRDGKICITLYPNKTENAPFPVIIHSE